MYPLIRLFTQVQLTLIDRVWHQVHEDYARLGIRKTRPINGSQCNVRGLQDGLRIVCGVRQRHDGASGILRPLAKRAGANKHQHLPGHALIFTQFYTRLRSKVADCLAQLVQLQDSLAKASGTRNLLACRCLGYKINARDAVQFLPGALKRYAPPLSDRRAIQLYELLNGLNLERVQRLGNVRRIAR